MALMGDYHMSELYFVWGNPWPLRGDKAAMHTFGDGDSAMRATFGQYVLRSFRRWPCARAE
jgi:hypothetical protein